MKKKVLVFAGPSGVGKSTLSKYLLSQYDYFKFSVSATTREIREGEVEGVDYYFHSKESFQENITSDNFIEWEEVYEGRFYGTLKSEIKRINGSQNVAVFDIDVLGALNIKKMFKDEAHIVFVKPESVHVLEQRLRGRGTESEDEISLRMNRFEKELSFEDSFDDIIVNRNGKVKESYLRIDDIVDNQF